MADSRRKNVNWDVMTCTGGSGKAQTAVLMDIRDELQRLNALLHCENFVAIPSLLRKLERNTRPKRQRRAVRNK